MLHDDVRDDAYSHGGASIQQWQKVCIPRGSNLADGSHHRVVVGMQLLLDGIVHLVDQISGAHIQAASNIRNLCLHLQQRALQILVGSLQRVCGGQVRNSHTGGLARTKDSTCNTSLDIIIVTTSTQRHAHNAMHTTPSTYMFWQVLQGMLHRVYHLLCILLQLLFKCLNLRCPISFLDTGDELVGTCLHSAHDGVGEVEKAGEHGGCSGIAGVFCIARWVPVYGVTRCNRKAAAAAPLNAVHTVELACRCHRRCLCWVPPVWYAEPWVMMGGFARVQLLY